MKIEEGMLVAYKNDDDEYVLCTVDCEDHETQGLLHLTEIFPSSGQSYEYVSESDEEMIFLAQNFANREEDITRELLLNVVLSLCRRKGKAKEEKPLSGKWEGTVLGMDFDSGEKLEESIEVVNARLGKLGDEGWEPVGVQYHPAEAMVFASLKRRKQ